METSKQLHYYRLSVAETLSALQTSHDGLAQREAAKRLRHNGPNRLPNAPRTLAIKTFVAQGKNILVIMLALASLICVILGDLRTGSILLAILVVNVSIGYFQNLRTERVVEGMQDLMVSEAAVLRAGKLHKVTTAELVIGDVVYIENGDIIPADLRIIEESELATNDFPLTGVASPSRKFSHAIHASVPLSHRHNLALMGATVASGTAYGVVIATGTQTELGRIAHLSQSGASKPSPLHHELHHVTRIIAICTLVLAALVAAIAMHADLGLENTLLFVLAIAAAMIPSGLATEVNGALAIAARSLAKHRALVKHLPAIETIGSTSVILTDKTGTLTQNKMVVRQMMIGREVYAASGDGYDPNGLVHHGKQHRALSPKQLQRLEPFFASCAGASNAAISAPDAEHADWYVIGDPTEGALIALALKTGIDIDEYNQTHPEKREFQFDAGRRLMSSLREYEGQQILLVKGAPEVVLERSRELWDHGTIKPLNPSDRAGYAEYLAQESSLAMRNIALAYRILPKNVDARSLTMEEAEQHLVFLGIASMVDPLRTGVVKAMKIARSAGIQVAITTGDAPLTAARTAAEAHLGIDTTVVSGDELAHLSDSQIVQIIGHGGAVFSRVSPEDKLRIVEIMRRSGHIVAVTGDGINDVPALKQADIGAAMGKDGSDVAKEAAELVLLDDSFESLVASVERGRLTQQNIRRTIRCALTTNFSELIIVLLGLGLLLALRIPPALPAIQIIAIDLVAQILPIIALAWDKPSSRLMHTKPNNRPEHIVTRRALSSFALYGGIAALLSYGNYLFFFIRTHLSPVAIDTATPLYLQATTLTYLTLALCLYIHILFERVDSHDKFFSDYLWNNKKLLIALAISFSMIIGVIYTPALNVLFATNPLSAMDWLCAVVAAGLYFAFRLSQRHTRKHSRKAVLKFHSELSAR